MEVRLADRSIGVLLAGGLCAALSAMAPGASAEIFRNYPDVIICAIPDGHLAMYVAAVEADGSALYRSLGNAFATVTPDRVVHHPGSKDCDGRTLDQIIKDNQARTSR